MSDIDVNYGSTKEETMSTTPGETFAAEVKVPAGASDTVLKLGLLTDPIALIVYGATGVSFKLDSTGTDAIKANPFAVVADEDGLSIDEILLSNSAAQEQTVYIYAEE